MTGTVPSGSTGPAEGPTGRTGPIGPSGSTGAAPQDSRLRGIVVPEKFASEPWAKEVKSIDDLWSKMAGAQKLLGKDKVVLPGDNATPEEVNAFHQKLGRPDNPEGYEFKNITSLKDVNRNVELDHGMKKIFFEEGISKAAGERIVAKYEELIYTMHEPTIKASAQRDLEFQKLADEVLGADKASTIEAFKSVMREALGNKAHLAAKIESLSNDELLPLMVLSKNIHDKYTGENRVRVTPSGSPQFSGDLKADFQMLSQQKIAIKTDDKIPEHIRKMKLANINTQMMKLGEKAGQQGIDLFK